VSEQLTLQYNYNERFDKSQYLRQKFKENFIKNLPKYIRAFKTKGKFNRKKRIYVETAVENYKFIEYNKEVCAFLIVDIDHRKKEVWEIFEILRERNILPSFFIYTSRGYQIGWELEHPFVLNEKYQKETDKRNEKYAKLILKKLTYLLDGDFNAVRLKGIWRNPLKNKSRVYPSKRYLLNELDIFVEFIDQKEEIKTQELYFHTDGNNIKNKVAQILLDRTNIKNVRIGERNSVLWYTGMFLTKEIIKTSSSKKEIMKKFTFVKKSLFELNKNLQNPLAKKEVKNIVKSITKYLNTNSIYVSFGNANEWDKNTRKKYMRIYRLKNGLVKKSNEQRKREHLRKVANALTQTNKIAEAVKISGLGKTAFYKYYKILKNNLKVLFLYKLLVNLQKVNHEKKESVLKFINSFSDTVFYIYSNLSSVFSLNKLTEFDILFVKSSFIT
jgi:hypothetical protein